MNTSTLEKSFNKIGARVEIRPPRTRFANLPQNQVSVKVEGTGRNEHFVLEIGKDADIDIMCLDVQPDQRHMILQIRHDVSKRIKDSKALAPEKFLVGHDEMHFFAASVGRNVTKVRDAKDNLMPNRVKSVVEQTGLRKKDKHRRNNSAFKRQGEWFFIPQPDLHVDKKFILYNEPLQRDRTSKPHSMSECYRIGGTTVYVGRGKELSQDEFNKIDDKSRKLLRQMRRNPKVYCRGKIKHADHHTLDLGSVWHEVSLNGEIRTQSLGFLD